MQQLILALVLITSTYTSKNFQVEAATPEQAKYFSQYAEYYRGTISSEWFGYKLVSLPERCMLRVEITNKVGTGVTKFKFEQSRLTGMTSTIKGSYQEITKHILPHEVTHMLMMQYFGRPIPRWIEEGVAVLSEKIPWTIKPLRIMPSGELFRVVEYPEDVISFYKQSSGTCKFLLLRGDRKTFLQFVEDGMREGFTSSLWKHYKLTNYGLDVLWSNQ